MQEKDLIKRFVRSRIDSVNLRLKKLNDSDIPVSSYVQKLSEDAGMKAAYTVVMEYIDSLD